MHGILPGISQLLLGAYYYSSLPVRWRRNAAACQAERAPVMILFYHRIADHTLNDWSMPLATFQRQLDWLQRHFDLVSLDEAQQRIASGCNGRPAVAITFDDGYAENCQQALPLLIQRRIPVTYFVASRNVLEGRPFPHDLAQGVSLPVNTVEQLCELVARGVEIGAHTRTHADLGQITDDDTLYDELVVGRQELEEALQCPIRYFSFPYGLHQNLSQRAFAMARANGFAAVCSAYGGYNLPGDDAFHLQRIHADPGMIRLKNWLTVDPRKVARVQRYLAHDHLDQAQLVGGGDMTTSW